MNESSFAMVEEYVLGLLKNAKSENAELIASEVGALCRGSKSPSETILKTYHAIKELEKECDEFEFPEYILLANHPELIVKLVYHRLLIWSKDTSPKLNEAWKLNFKKCCLFQSLEEAKTKLPVFAYPDFLKGNHNVVFYELSEKPGGTTDEDYWQMRAWQYQKIAEAIELKVEHFSKTFRQCYTDGESLADNIRDEIGQLKFIFEEGKQLDILTLKTSLFEVKALANSWLPDDEKRFLAGFKKFLSDGPDYSSFTVSTLNGLCSAYQTTNEACFLTSPHVLGLSLVRYGDWLEALLKRDIALTEKIVQSLDYLSICEHAISTAMHEVAEYENRLKAEITALIPAEDYKKYLFAELDERRIAWNEAEKFGYLQQMESKQTLCAYFRLQCIVGNNPEIQAKALRASIIAELESDALWSIFESKYLDPILSKSIGSLNTVQFEVVSFIHHMVPDSKLITHLWHSAATALSELAKGNKPPLFVLNNLFERFNELYLAAEQRLEKYLTRIDGSYSREYISDVKREFRRKFQLQKEPGNNLLDYTQQLNQLLCDEFELVRSHTKPVDLTKLLAKVEAPKSKFSFGYKKTDKEILAAKIRQLVVDPEIELLKSETNINDLLELLTAKDIDKLPFKPIFLNCRTNQFALIIDEMSRFFSCLTPAAIEKSGRFISANGKPIKASNLYRAETEKPKAHRRIKEILQ